MIQDTRTCFHQNRSLNKQNNNKASLIFDWPVLFVKKNSVCLLPPPASPSMSLYMLHCGLISGCEYVPPFDHPDIWWVQSSGTMKQNILFRVQQYRSLQLPSLKSALHKCVVVFSFSNNVHSSKLHWMLVSPTFAVPLLPWYNCRGWLGVKKKLLTYCTTDSFATKLCMMMRYLYY